MTWHFPTSSDMANELIYESLVILKFGDPGSFQSFIGSSRPFYAATPRCHLVSLCQNPGHARFQTERSYSGPYVHVRYWYNSFCIGFGNFADSSFYLHLVGAMAIIRANETSVATRNVASKIRNFAQA